MMKKILIIIVLLVLVLGSAGLYLYGTSDYSEGTRIGTLNKFSRKGVVFKTYEGELNMNMYVGDMSATNASGTVWPFSALDNRVLLEEISKYEGKRVKLTYGEKYVKFPWRGDTKYIVNKIELIK